MFAWLCDECLGNLHVVDTDDLVYPADKGWYFDIDTGDLLPTAAKTPAYKTRQLVISFIFTHQGTASITLQSVNKIG